MNNIIGSRLVDECYRTVTITRGNNLAKITLGDKVSFDELKETMKMCVPSSLEKSAKLIKDELTTSHKFSHLGVSVIPTIHLYGEDYLMTIEKPGKGKERILYPMSCHLSTTVNDDPLLAVKRLISEEILVIASGKRMGFEFYGEILPDYYTEKYDKDGVIKIKNLNRYSLPDMEKDCAVINGTMVRFLPSLYYSSATNSAQLVYRFKMDRGETNLFLNQGSINHVERKFDEGIDRLDMELHLKGIKLICVENGELTGNITHMENGSLRNEDPRNVMLSEAFVPKDNGVTLRTKISLDEYLCLHQSNTNYYD